MRYLHIKISPEQAQAFQNNEVTASELWEERTDAKPSKQVRFCKVMQGPGQQPVMIFQIDGNIPQIKRLVLQHDVKYDAPFGMGTNWTPQPLA